MNWKLSALRGASMGSEIHLARLPFLIGRTRTCDLIETDEHVSRYHCQLVVNDGALFVLDNSSRNGVFVNGQRIMGAQQVQAGDCIRIGSAIYCVGTHECRSEEIEETKAESVEATDSMPASVRPLACDDAFK